MSLQKGFLQPKITLEVLNLNTKKLIFGILLWLGLSFSIYSILYILRESFRYTSFWWNREDFLVLTPGENYFYNFFFAFLACTFAFTAISNQWIRRASTLRNIPRYKKASIFHDKVSFSWYFTYWFSKMGVLFGFTACTMGAFSEFSLFPHYVFLFVLMLLNLFFHQWLRVRLIFKNSILPWMLGTFGITLFVSSLFASVDLISFEDLNESILKNTIAYHISQDLPVLENTTEVMKKSLLTNIYVGNPKQNSDSIPKIVVRYFPDPISYVSLDMLEAFIKKERSMLDEFERDQLIWRLSIDQHVKMKYVKKLKNELARNNEGNIQYASSDGHSNSFVFGIGLRQRLQHSEFISSQYLSEEEDEVVVKLVIKDNNRIWFNESEVTLNELKKVIRKFFVVNESLGVVEWDIDNDSNFEVYIEVYDLLVGTIGNLRDEWAMKNFRTHYSGVESYDSTQQHIDDLARQQFPFSVIEKD